MTPAVRIRAKSPKGHRRCDVRHPPASVLHPPGAFTDEQLQTMQDDPRLLVEVVGELAMGALSAPELASILGDAPEGAVLAGWEAHAAPTLPAVVPTSAPAEAVGRLMILADIDPADIDVGGAMVASAEAPAEAPEQAARTRKPRGA